jgi:DNA-binding PadR family transcriptional regulator
MLAHMALGEFELLILLAVRRLGGGAYGVPIRDEIQERTGREVARGAVYVTLDRLVRKRHLKAQMGDATAERGGRAKRYFELTPAGLKALRESLEAVDRMQHGLALIPRRS